MTLTGFSNDVRQIKVEEYFDCIAQANPGILEVIGLGGDPTLAMDETSPADVPGMLAAAAIVTSRGGLASHAAVVARSAGKPAVCGATALRFDSSQGAITAGGRSRSRTACC